jgi:hypothetical protein
MKGEELYNLFETFIYLLEEHGVYQGVKYENAKWDKLTDKEKIWYNTVAEVVDLNELGRAVRAEGRI